MMCQTLDRIGPSSLEDNSCEVMKADSEDSFLLSLQKLDTNIKLSDRDFAHLRVDRMPLD